MYTSNIPTLASSSKEVAGIVILLWRIEKLKQRLEAEMKKRRLIVWLSKRGFKYTTAWFNSCVTKESSHQVSSQLVQWVKRQMIALTLTHTQTHTQTHMQTHMQTHAQNPTLTHMQTHTQTHT